MTHCTSRAALSAAPSLLLSFAAYGLVLVTGVGPSYEWGRRVFGAVFYGLAIVELLVLFGVYWSLGQRRSQAGWTTAFSASVTPGAFFVLLLLFGGRAGGELQYVLLLAGYFAVCAASGSTVFSLLGRAR